MHKTTTAALAAGFDVLSMALQEVARTRPAAGAGLPGGGAFRQRVTALAVGLMSPAADEAVTAEMAPLFAPLRVSARA